MSQLVPQELHKFTPAERCPMEVVVFSAIAASCGYPSGGEGCVLESTELCVAAAGRCSQHRRDSKRWSQVSDLSGVKKYLETFLIQSGRN